ncbi:unnamed protein product, partial [Closterium sp. NIES-64]
MAAARWRLDGQTALVTGATKGIGRAIANELASLGAHVFVCSRGEADVAATVAELQSQGWAATGWACDVKEPEQREVLITKVSEAFGGKLNHLINNVGTNIRKPTVEYSLSDFHHVWGTNFESAYHLCQLAHPLLKAAASAGATDGTAKGNVSIVFNSSVAGVVAIRSGTLYGATKAAMNQLTKNLACEWAKDGIRVNAVAPWYMATDLANQVLKDEAFSADVISRTPMRRVGEPQEAAAAVAFMCLPAASYVSGQVLAVDGAFTEAAAAVAFMCMPAASYVSGQVLAVDGAFTVNGPFPASPPPPFSVPILVFAPEITSPLPSSSFPNTTTSFESDLFDSATLLRALTISALLVVIGGLIGLIIFRLAVVWIVWTRTRHVSPWRLLVTLPFLHPFGLDSDHSASAGRATSTQSSGAADTNASVDVETASTNEGQEASARSGKLVKKGASTQQLAQLVTNPIAAEQEEKQECIVCLSEMVVGESAVTLPCCNKSFHQQCITAWLATAGA